MQTPHLPPQPLTTRCRSGVSCSFLPSWMYFSLCPRYRTEFRLNPQSVGRQRLGTVPILPRGLDTASPSSQDGCGGQKLSVCRLTWTLCWWLALFPPAGCHSWPATDRQFSASLSPSSVYLPPPHLAFGPSPPPRFRNQLTPWLPSSLVYSFAEQELGTLKAGTDPKELEGPRGERGPCSRGPGSLLGVGGS